MICFFSVNKCCKITFSQEEAGHNNCRNSLRHVWRCSGREKKIAFESFAFTSDSPPLRRGQRSLCSTCTLFRGWPRFWSASTDDKKGRHRCCQGVGSIFFRVISAVGVGGGLNPCRQRACTAVLGWAEEEGKTRAKLTWSQMSSHFFSLSYCRNSRALSGGRFMEFCRTEEGKGSEFIACG